MFLGNRAEGGLDDLPADGAVLRARGRSALVGFLVVLSGFGQKRADSARFWAVFGREKGAFVRAGFGLCCVWDFVFNIFCFSGVGLQQFLLLLNGSSGEG